MFFLCSVRHSFYQSDAAVNVQIPIKGLKKDQVQLATTDTTLSVKTQVPATGNDYSLDIDLAYPIDSSRTTFNVTGSNVSRTIENHSIDNRFDLD